MTKENGGGQRSEDWFEDRDPSGGAPVRFVERRRGDRRRGAKPVVDVSLSPRNEPIPTVSLVIPTRNEARNVADVLDRIPDFVSEVVLVDTRSSDVTKLMASSARPDIRIIEEPARQGKRPSSWLVGGDRRTARRHGC